MTKQKYTKIELLLDSDVSFTTEELQDELGIYVIPNRLPAFKLFMLNFAEFRQPIGFRLGSHKWLPHEFNIHDVTFSTAQGVVAVLHEAKLAKLIKGTPRARKDKAQLSRVVPSKRLLKWLDTKFPYADSIYLNPQTHVRLRQANKREYWVSSEKKVVPYQPTSYSKYVDGVMKDYHSMLIDWGLTIDHVAIDKLHMYINFSYYDDDKNGNPNIRYDGRWWSEYMQITSKDRTRRISFERAKGELVEVDFTSSQLTALRYWEIGREPETDHYLVFRHDDYINRDHVKKLSNMMLNRKRSGLAKAYAKSFYLTAEGKPRKTFSIKQKIERHWIYDTAGRFLNKQQAIRHWFLKGRRIGALASFIESNLVLEIVRRCCMENIPVLTVYDSFIVPKKHEKRLKELMYQEDVFKHFKAILKKDEQQSVKELLDSHKTTDKPPKWTIYEKTKCDNCGKEIPPSKRKQFCSKKCQLEYKDKQLQKEADKKRLIYLGRVKDSNYRRYRFKKCKHKQNIKTDHVRTGAFECKTCIKELHISEAEAVGLILIGRVKDSNYRRYQFKKCKHKQNIAVSHVRNNLFVCNQCEETTMTLPSQVYLLKMKHKNFSWVKLGYGKSIRDRIRLFDLVGGVSVAIVNSLPFDTGKEAIGYEQSIHKKYKKNKLPFKEMKQYLQNQGGNECYPLEMLDTLLEELESK